MTEVYINRIATAVPPFDIHSKFVDYVLAMLTDDHNRALFKRMAGRSQIEHRYSFFEPDHLQPQLEKSNFYKPGAFPDTHARMKFYERNALSVACKAVDDLGIAELKKDITHLIVTSCTGFYAPGLDLQLVQHYGLSPSVERTLIGFMGCYAGINALKTANHIVRSKPQAKVLIVNLELCTLHLQESQNLEELLSFLVFADGCAASIVSAEPKGIRIRDFYCDLIPDSEKQITWHIGPGGFDMVLSGEVPKTILHTLQASIAKILNGVALPDIRHWAIHPGGRTILDAVQDALTLPKELLQFSRETLRDYGNTSSASVMFVLKKVLESKQTGPGCAIAFGPGLGVESMSFVVDGGKS